MSPRDSDGPAQMQESSWADGDVMESKMADGEENKFCVILKVNVNMQGIVQ